MTLQSSSLFNSILLDQSILSLTQGADPFSRHIEVLKEDPQIDPALFDRLKPPEFLCTEGELPIHHYQDLSLKENHPLFKPVHQIVQLIQNFPAAQELIAFYKSYLDKVCRSKGQARIDLLKGSARLYTEKGCYLVGHGVARKIASLNLYGESVTCPVGGVQFKQIHAPLAEGARYAAQVFEELLFAEGPLPSQLMKIEGIWIKAALDPANLGHRARNDLDQAQANGMQAAVYFKEFPERKAAYPFQEKRISRIVRAFPDVEGEFLSERLQKGASLALDPYHFSSLCLLTLCLLPSCGKADRYKLASFKNKEKLIAVDDIGPYSLFSENENSQFIRSALFLLPHMHQPIEPGCRERLLALNPQILFLEWLVKLHEKNKSSDRWKAVATPEEQEALQCPAALSPAAMQHSYRTLLGIQEFLKQHASATHWELLHFLFPTHAAIYQHLLDKAGHDIPKAHALLFSAEGSSLPASPEAGELPLSLLAHWTSSLHFQHPQEQEAFLSKLFFLLPQETDIHISCVFDDHDFLRVFSQAKHLKSLTLSAFPRLTHQGILALMHHHPSLHLVLGEVHHLSAESLEKVIRFAWENSRSLSLQIKDKTLLIEAAHLNEAMACALDQGHPAYAQLFITLGADFQKSQEEESLMHKYAQGYPETLDFLIKKGISVLQKDSRGRTPLHLAAQGGRTESISRLIQAKAALEERDREGRTPLFYAVLGGKEENVSILLNHHADLSVISHEKDSIFHLGASYGHLSILKMLFQGSSEAERKKILVQGDGDGKTILHRAVWGDPKPEIVRLLIENGADVNARNNFGYTALHWAAKHGHLESVQQLTEKGAEFSYLNANGESAFDLALRWGQDEVVRYLIDPQSFKKAEMEEKSSEEVYDLEGQMYTHFERAWGSGRLVDQIFYLEKMSEMALKKNDYIKAAHLLNAALSLAHKHQLHPRYQQLFFKRLERLEGECLQINFGVKTPADRAGHVAASRIKLHSIRQSAQTMLKENEAGDRIQHALTEALGNFLFELIEESLHWIQKSPPTPFSVFTTGELAHQETQPYSGFGLMFILKKKTPDSLDFFRRLSLYLELRVINLGETSWELIRPSREKPAQSMTPRGFSMVISPRGKEGLYELIGTPSDLAVFQTPGWLKEHEAELAFAMSLAQAAYVYGDKKLAQLYHQEMFQCLERRHGTGWILGRKEREFRATQLMQQFASRFHVQERQSVFDIKKAYTLLCKGIKGLMFANGIRARNLLEGIELLSQKKVISEKGAVHLKHVIGLLSHLRLRAHLFYQQANEKLYGFSSQANPERFALQEGEQHLLTEIFQTLVPFHRGIQLFLKNDKKFLGQNELLDRSVQFHLEAPLPSSTEALTFPPVSEESAQMKDMPGHESTQPLLFPKELNPSQDFEGRPPLLSPGLPNPSLPALDRRLPIQSLSSINLHLNEQQISVLERFFEEKEFDYAAMQQSIQFIQQWKHELQAVVKKQRSYEIKTDQQQALVNHPNPHVGDYYEVVWMRLSETLLACKTLHSDHMENTFQNHFDTAATFLEYIHSFSTTDFAKTAGEMIGAASEEIPFAGLAAKGIGYGFRFLSDRDKKKSVQRLARLCPAIDQVDTLCEEIARKLAQHRLSSLEKISFLAKNTLVTRFKQKWDQFLVNEHTTEGKKMGLKDAERILEMVVKDSTGQYRGAGIVEKLIGELLGEPVKTIQTDGEAVAMKTTSASDEKLNLASHDFQILQEEVKMLRKEKAAMRKDLEELKKKMEDEEVDGGNQAMMGKVSPAGKRAGQRDLEKSIAQIDKQMQIMLDAFVRAGLEMSGPGESDSAMRKELLGVVLDEEEGLT